MQLTELKEILEMFYFKDMTYEKIAKRKDLSTTYIHNLVNGEDYADKRKMLGFDKEFEKTYRQKIIQAREKAIEELKKEFKN